LKIKDLKISPKKDNGGKRITEIIGRTRMKESKI
jgi:hypothetical protein